MSWILRTAFNGTRDIVWSVDRDYKIIYANRSFHDRMLHIMNSYNGDASSIYYSKLLKAWHTYYEEAIERGQCKVVTEVVMYGRKFTEEISFDPLYKNGNIVGVQCFARDITAYSEYINIIEEKNERLKEIEWIQSHQVRNHVATLLGLAQLIEIDDVHDTLYKDILMGIKTTALLLDVAIHQVSDKAAAARGGFNDRQ